MPLWRGLGPDLQTVIATGAKAQGGVFQVTLLGAAHTWPFVPEQVALFEDLSAAFALLVCLADDLDVTDADRILRDTWLELYCCAPLLTVTPTPDQIASVVRHADGLRKYAVTELLTRGCLERFHPQLVDPRKQPELVEGEVSRIKEELRHAAKGADSPGRQQLWELLGAVYANCVLSSKIPLADVHGQLQLQVLVREHERVWAVPANVDCVLERGRRRGIPWRLRRSARVLRRGHPESWRVIGAIDGEPGVALFEDLVRALVLDSHILAQLEEATQEFAGWPPRLIPWPEAPAQPDRRSPSPGSPRAAGRPPTAPTRAVPVGPAWVVRTPPRGEQVGAPPALPVRSSGPPAPPPGPPMEYPGPPAPRPEWPPLPLALPGSAPAVPGPVPVDSGWPRQISGPAPVGPAAPEPWVDEPALPVVPRFAERDRGTRDVPAAAVGPHEADTAQLPVVHVPPVPPVPPAPRHEPAAGGEPPASGPAHLPGHKAAVTWGPSDRQPRYPQPRDRRELLLNYTNEVAERDGTLVANIERPPQWGDSSDGVVSSDRPEGEAGDLPMIFRVIVVAAPLEERALVTVELPPRDPEVPRDLRERLTERVQNLRLTGEELDELLDNLSQATGLNVQWFVIAPALTMVASAEWDAQRIRTALEQLHSNVEGYRPVPRRHEDQ